MSDIERSSVARAADNPYPGPKALQYGQSIFGRDDELAQLRRILFAHRIVLLYSPSGAGKSSLLEAGLRPLLDSERVGTRQEKLGIIGPLRVGAPPDARDAGSGNRYLRSLLAGLPGAGAAGVSPEEGALDARLRPFETSRNVLIFDQFEELLTAQVGDDEAKATFLRILGVALEDRSRSAIFAMREDYIAGLDPFLYLIPTRFGTRFRIDLLKPERALEAVKGPAREHGRPFDDGAAEELISDLRRVQVARGDGTLGYEDGPYVDPLHLQLVCRNLWTKTMGRDRIGVADVVSDEADGDSSVELALRRYYAAEVGQISADLDVDQREIRGWFDTQLIVGGYRGQTQASPVGRVPVDHPLTQRLLDSHLVRTNRRGGTTWFELAHDRLIDPVKRDNREWRREHGTPLELAADAWDQQGRVSSALVIGDDLDRLRAFDQGPLTDVERSYLLASEEADQRARADAEEQRLEKERLKQEMARRERSLRIVSSVLVAFIALAGVAAVVLLMVSEERGKANAAAAESRAARLALESSDALHEGDLELSALLGVEAFKGVEPFGPTHIGTAKEALLRADQAFSPSLITFLRSPDPSGTPIRSLAFGPDGTTLASGSLDGKVTLFDAEDWSRPGVPAQGRSGPVASIAFHQDAILASGSVADPGGYDEAVTIWDVSDPNERWASLERSKGSVSSIAFSPDGSTLASGSNAQVDGAATGTVSVWDVADPDRPEKLLEAVTGPVASIAVSGDGSTVASSSSGTDGRVSVWEARDPGTPLKTLGDEERAVTSIALSPDGSVLAIGSSAATRTTGPQSIDRAGSAPDIRIDLWDVQTGTRLGSPLEGHVGRVTSLAFDPDGSHLASGDSGGAIVLWDLAGRTQLAKSLEGRHGEVRGVAFSPDGSILASGSIDGTISIWDVRGGSQLAETYDGEGEVTSLAFRPDSRTLVAGTADGSVVRLDVADGAPLGAPSNGEGDEASAIVLSADGSRLAVGSDDGSVTIWDAERGIPLGDPIHAGQGGASAIAFSPDRSRLAVGSGDGAVSLWDPERGVPIGDPFPGDPGGVTAIAFSPDGGRLAVGSRDGTVSLWDASSPGSPATAPTNHAGEVTSVAFSPDGGWLASGSEDRTIRLWNLRADPQRAISFQLKGHNSPVTSVAFSPDGTTLASGSGDDGVVILWDVASRNALGDPLETENGHILSVAFSPDGDSLASGSAEGEITVWDVDPASWAERLCDRTNRDLSQEEWDAYLPDEPLSMTCTTP